MWVVFDTRWLRWAMCVLALLLLVLTPVAKEVHLCSTMEHRTNCVGRWKWRRKLLPDASLRMLRKGRGWVESGTKLRLAPVASMLYIWFWLKEKTTGVMPLMSIFFFLLTSFCTIVAIFQYNNPKKQQPRNIKTYKSRT